MFLQCRLALGMEPTLHRVHLSDTVVQPAHAAQVLAGGRLIRHASGGQFYAPTVLAGVTPAHAHLARGGVRPCPGGRQFGSDDEAVALANDCPFGLGSAVFSRSIAARQRHWRALGGAAYLLLTRSPLIPLSFHAAAAPACIRPEQLLHP